MIHSYMGGKRKPALLHAVGNFPISTEASCSLFYRILRRCLNGYILRVPVYV